MQRLTAPLFASVLVFAACSADSDDTTTSVSAGSTSGSASESSQTGSSSGTSETPTTGTPTTGTPTTDTSDTTIDPTTGEASATTEATTEGTTEGTTDGTTEGTTDGTTDGTTGDGLCGNGVVDGDEACDDGNLNTELSMSQQPPLMYSASACIDDCSLVLSLCGDGKVDPGEACDDGNANSQDDCTTSCTINNKNYGSPCVRMCNQSCDTDVSSGTFTGCDNMVVPEGAKAVCYVSTKFNLAPRYFAEGACATTAQTCMGLACPPNIGNYDALKTCPEGSALVDRTTMAFGVTVKTKVCQQACVSDADCRWNAYDTVWAKPGQYRCQTTPDSGGKKICADAQN